MGFSKASRKGKKAWRRNIDTRDVEEAQAEKTRRQRQGPAARDLPDARLFFVDQAPSSSTSIQKLGGGKETKLLRSQAIIQATQSAKPVKQTTKRRLVPKAHHREPAASQALPAAAPANSSETLDIWGSSGGAAPRKRHKTDHLSHAVARRRVEVDLPGSSYNPDPAQQEEALAEAVAEEMTRADKALLQAAAPQRAVPLGLGEEDDELPLLQVEEDAETTQASGSESHDEVSPPVREQRKKTRAERNKQKRLRQLNQEAQQRQMQKQQQKELHTLPQLQVQLAAAQAEQERCQRRRAVIQAEKALAGPGHLGKLKYLPPAVQVLLREEVGGGLRALKAAPTIVKDRFNALQRRGLIETRLPVRSRRPARRIPYQPGDRAARAQEAQAELDSLRKKR